MQNYEIRWRHWLHTNVIGFDLVEVNPQLDVGTGITSYLAAHTVIEFFGHFMQSTALGNASNCAGKTAGRT